MSICQKFERLVLTLFSIFEIHKIPTNVTETALDVFFSPLACSLASRITIYEANAERDVTFHHVDLRTKRLTADQIDYLTINPTGQVPALRLDNGTVITENPAILYYLADRYPNANLGSQSDDERYELLRWLSFVGCEVHKQIFSPLFNPMANDGAKDFARQASAKPFATLERHLENRDTLIDHFSIADIYLGGVLNWAPFVAIDLQNYPAIQRYLARLNERPAFVRATGEELQMVEDVKSAAATEL